MGTTKTTTTTTTTTSKTRTTTAKSSSTTIKTTTKRPKLTAKTTKISAQTTQTTNSTTTPLTIETIELTNTTAIANSSISATTDIESGFQPISRSPEMREKYEKEDEQPSKNSYITELMSLLTKMMDDEDKKQIGAKMMQRVMKSVLR